jgi:hypothetical protein
MSIWVCGSPACYCQPAVAGGFIDCRSQEWAYHSPSRAGFVYLEFCWVQMPLLQVFPSPSTLGRWRYACLLWPACFFTVHVGSAPSPFSSGAFLTTATVTSFPTPRLLGGPCHSCPLWPTCLFIVLWGIAPPSLFGAQSAPPSLLRVFCCCCLLFSLVFFSFFPGWGSVCPGGYADLAQGCLWECPGAA